MFNEKQIDEIVRLAFEAGKIAISFFDKKNFEIYKKPDNSKVTSADLEISKFLEKNLSQEFHGTQIICEENDVRTLISDEFFLIDPIDGTSSFINNEDQFAINIAVVKNKKPVFGLIYAPLFEGGKMIYNNSQNQLVLIEDITTSKKQKIITAKLQSKRDSLKIITSTRTKEADIKNYIEQIYPNFIDNFELERLSSAVKFFRLVESSSNVYLHLRPSMEWDIASGHFLVELIGAKLKSLNVIDGKISENENFYYQKENFLNGAFVAKFF